MPRLAADALCGPVFEPVAIYQVAAKIGEGGMGEVYRARDTRLNREVALKVLPQTFAADPYRMARFQREAQLLASLNHPKIAAIYGLEESGSTRALVMELVEGPTLAERIGRAAQSARPKGASASPAQVSAATGREPVTSLDGFWRFHTGDNPVWANPDFKTFANAGHLLPYLDGKELTVADGLPLGIAEENMYTEMTWQLDPGDRLTFVSDGVVEAREPSGELYGLHVPRASAISPQKRSRAQRSPSARKTTSPCLRSSVCLPGKR